MLKEDHYSINKLFVSDNAVCRTAQATPVLRILTFSVKVTKIIYIDTFLFMKCSMNLIGQNYSFVAACRMLLTSKGHGNGAFTAHFITGASKAVFEHATVFPQEALTDWTAGW